MHYILFIKLKSTISARRRQQRLIFCVFLCQIWTIHVLADSHMACDAINSAHVGHHRPPRNRCCPNTIAPSLEPRYVGLRVVKTRGVNTTVSNHGIYNFGEVQVLEKPKVMHTFLLRNDSDRPITIQKIHPSCGCTSAIFIQSSKVRTSQPSKITTNELPTLAPRQTASLRVAINLQSLNAGSVQKSVVVYTKGNPSPALLRDLSGVLKPNITFSPSFLDFGHIRPGVSLPLTLLVKMDARLADGNHEPFLASSNSFVFIRPLQDRTRSVRLQNREAKNASRKTLAQVYEVSLSEHAPLGLIMGRISFVPLRKNINSEVAASLRNASVLVIGHINGDISVSPQTLAFGTVAAGRETRQKVLLISKVATTFDHVKITCDNQWVSAHISTDDPRPIFFDTSKAASIAEELEVMLDPQAPTGTLATKVRITLANGQYVLVPVTAVVEARGD